METPTVPINFVPAKAGETFKVGTITIRIMEDGSRTGSLSLFATVLAFASDLTLLTCRQIHDESFLVTQGTLRFHALNGQTVDAKLGDYVTVPPRSPHTFSNPYDQEAKFFNTYTPAFYINYFRLLATMNEQGQPMNPEANRKAMGYFATIGVADDEMQMDKQQFYGDADPTAKK
ncbi:hypothetical protein AYL99_07170 [Fonsecaea erecta]|uniref:Cupin type-2 domain-containing protein n=1 Tax=Fonsecaea erecta TaxID=1367422 RepID=A0A178ZE37_9EURO|nr:hypothetical protein AYL99_07170 [Fonsecaea erecta]OAP58080.1 hypothetical protein AYL99_07170 [Fonsecaea erecta]